MSAEFKQCANGHYYQGVSCPYCKTGNQAGAATSLKTSVFMGGTGETTEIDPMNGGCTGGGNTTTVIDGNTVVTGPHGPTRGSRTVFGDDDEGAQNPSGCSPKKEPRYGRKLVGWLVTYSFDELGEDYKLYEGRNIIGRDVDCNITVNDGRMSGKHAVLLFRSNKYSLTDSQSSHGTFVNDEDIDLEPRYLKDGDIIRMGTTVFKFRTSL